jgi:tight adherence protein B
MNTWIVAGSVAFAGVSAAALAYGVAESADTRAQLWAARYTQNLDDALRRMLLPPRGRVILYVQCLAVGLSLLGAAALRAPALCLCVPLVLAAPKLVLKLLRKRRRDAIEAKLDGFALALANALRASPSIGRALQTLQSTLPKPIDDEIAHVLRELRVGSSVDQALLNFSWRVQSDPLDALLSSVLVARRIGGSLPETLETTAATLREMARLEGLLRSKTAQSRMQIWVLGCMPPALVFAFDRVNPGYFDVLTKSPVGWTVIAVVVLLWLAAVVLARKLMAVEL